MIIAITGFKPKNLLKKFRFLSHAVPLFQLAQKSPGNIHAERFTHQGYYHTIHRVGVEGCDDGLCLFPSSSKSN